MTRNYDNDPVGTQDAQAAADKYDANVGYMGPKYGVARGSNAALTEAQADQMICDEIRLEDCDSMD